VAIEKGLFQATGAILPSQPEMKTATELAELCRLVQEGTRRKLNILRRELRSRGVAIPSDEEGETRRASPATPQAQPLLRFSIGGPLESVMEGDVETDCATTPGSLIQPSPFYSATRKRKTSITPTTPTMDSFSFSAGTSSLIHNMETPKDTPVNRRLSKTPDSKGTPSSDTEGSLDRQLRFDEFQEEDDMITIESRSTVVAKSPASRTARSPVKEDNSQFLARIEFMLEKVEESVLESRPSDETDRSRKFNASASYSSSMHGDSGNDADEESEFDDDSTNVVATQVASQVDDNAGVKHRRYLSPGKAPESYPAREPTVQRPTQIYVDTAAASPAHTNITMDMTMVNDTFAGMSILGDDDNSSTVTPILDRYRLDADDNSVGIKVVPNRRRTHTKKRESLGVPMTIRETSSENQPEFHTSPDGLRSPRGLPGSVSARKKQYRKTPFQKGQVEDDSFEPQDENNNPNTQFGGKKYRTTPFPKKQLSLDDSTCSHDSNPGSGMNFDSTLQQQPTSSNSNGFSIPPLRPRSLETANSAPMRPNHTRSASLPAKRNSRSPLSDAFIAKHLSSESKNRKSRAQPDENNSQENSLERRVKRIERITMAEYEKAPNIVRMQVRRDEANDSLDALEDFLTAHIEENPATPAFTENQGYQVLRNVLSSDQKSKSVLMSLCHWRRLLMFRDQAHGMIFRVNQFEQ
jgi:hypothetical protein